MYSINPLKKYGPLMQSKYFKDVKDPCPVFDGIVFHKFGSGGDITSEHWQILHAISSKPEGPWVELPPVQLYGLYGHHVAAPGVIYDSADHKFHMFVQTEFLSTGGTIEYLTSVDGQNFKKVNTPLLSLPGTDEAGIYDSHPAIIHGEKYLVYAGTKAVQKADKVLIQPNVFLAKSETNLWTGPWTRLGKILDHTDISWHHNDYEHPWYEWGIEGPQLIQLPSGQILLNAVCFLPTGEFTTRQRVFFAIAANIMGPYVSIGPILDPLSDPWGSGENGHAAAIIHDDLLHLFYQGRPKLTTSWDDASWKYGLAVYDPDVFAKAADNISRV